MRQAQECPHVPVSWGELLDKVTILQIKCERIASPQARENVARELALLRQIARDVTEKPRLAPLLRELRVVNADLWDIEDRIREREAAADFGPCFVQLARSVYTKNDERAAIKRQINRLLGSALVEEKSYAGAARTGADLALVAVSRPRTARRA